jgi:hypothetical protein
MRVLAVTSPTRLIAAPELSTAAEQGFPGIDPKMQQCRLSMPPTFPTMDHAALTRDPSGEEIIMQSLKTVLASLAIAMAATGTATAEPLPIRNSYVVPIAAWW